MDALRGLALLLLCQSAGEALSRGLHLPLTIILPALDAEPHLDLRFVDLMPRPFEAFPHEIGEIVVILHQK